MKHLLRFLLVLAWVANSEAAVNPTPHGNAVTDSFTKEDDYTELSDADVEDIETVLRRLQDNLSRSGTRAADLSFPGLTGTFVISGNLAHLLPQSPERVNPRFLVYTNRDGSEDVAAKAPVLEVGFEHRDNFSVVARALDVDQKLYFVVHGFHSRARARWVQHIKNEILAVENTTVIVVDWSQGAGKKNYSVAAGNTRVVARLLAMMLKQLVDAGAVNLSKVHYIGHSLGAQTGAFLGQDVYDLTRSKIGRITGLDPAAPLFEYFNVYLRAKHAHFVDIIHTSMGMGLNAFRGRLGMTKSSGHVDFFPNGGRHQPGCKAFGKFSCSHERATLYYANSIRTCSYPARQCSNYDAFREDACAPCSEVLCGEMGHNASTQLRGKQFLSISSEYPHCPGSAGCIGPPVWLTLGVILSCLRLSVF